MTTSNGRAVDRPKASRGRGVFSLERGGVARVGRLLARLAADIGFDAELLALSDPEPTRDFGPLVAHGGGQPSRFRVSVLDGRRHPLPFHLQSCRHGARSLPLADAAPPLRGLDARNGGLGFPNASATTDERSRRPVCCCRSATSPAGARPNSCHPRKEPRYAGWPRKRTTFPRRQAISAVLRPS